MKSALVKDFFREIKKSFSRWFSILFIVALGVAFFSGIRATSPDMKMTLDNYLDNTMYMDIRVLSTMGLTDEDILAISRVENVSAVEPSRTYDAYVIDGEDKRVLHFLSQPEMIGQYDLVEGRDIRDEDECVVDRYLIDKFAFKIGDQITVTAPGDDELKDHLTRDTFRIVGVVTSSSYFTINRDTTDIGTGMTDAFVYLSRDVFAADYYTAAYIIVKDAAEIRAFSDRYDRAVEKVTDLLEEIRTDREQARYDGIMEAAESEIADAQTELDDAKQKAESELSEAADKIAEAETEIADGWAELEDGKKTYANEVGKAEQKLSDAEKEIADGKSEIADGEQKLSDGKKQLAGGKKKLAASEKELAAGEKEYAAGLKAAQDGQARLDAAKAELDEKQEEIDTARETLAAGREQLDGQKSELESKQAELQTQQNELAAQKEQTQAVISDLKEKKQAADEAVATLEGGKAALEEQLANADELPEEVRAQLEEQLAGVTTQLEEAKAGQTQLVAGIEEAENGLAQIEAGLPQIEEGLSQISYQLEDPASELNAGYARLAAGEAELSEGQAQLDAGREEIENQQAVLDASFEELETARKTLDDGQKQLAAGKKEIAANEKKIRKSEKQLKNARSQIEDGEAELAEGRQELADKKASAESEFASAESELNAAESELADAKIEYEDGKKEADEKIAEGESELADAREKLADIKMPEWYILDRGKTAGYVDYGQNADRIGAIGRVFPLIFFLVAALISLTTMTRMVEAGRGEIGTLKALGYSQGAIAGKYVAYALSASIIGSLIGLVFGQKFIPWIIISTYMIIYPNLPVILTPLSPFYSILSSGAAILCVTGAAYAACRSAFRETPAQLMRPVAPQAGKKIWLEHITPLWQRFSFTRKVTLRNLFRYKKRFLMTVFGTGGCTALIVFGFGLTDSIGGVVTRQYDGLSHYDLSVSLKDDRSEKDEEELEDLLNTHENVKDWTRLRTRMLEIDGGKANYSAYLTVPEDPAAYAAYFTLTDRLNGGTYVMDDESVIITEKLADLMNLEKGGMLTVKDGDFSADFKVSAVAENYLMSYVFMSPALYEKTFGRAPEYNAIHIMASDASESAVDALSEDILALNAPSGTTTTAYTRSQFDTVLGSLDIITLVVVTAAAMLAFVVLYNLNNINITERRRELATIKVLGFYDQEVAAYIFRENILLTLIGAAIGLFFGKFLHIFIITTVETDVIMFVRHAQPASYLKAFLLTLVFSLAVNAIMFFSVRRIDMIESLKSVE